MVHGTKVIMTKGKLLNLKFLFLKIKIKTNSSRRPQVVNMKGM
jgi:hypothetical protein